VPLIMRRFQPSRYSGSSINRSRTLALDRRQIPATGRRPFAAAHALLEGRGRGSVIRPCYLRSSYGDSLRLADRAGGGAVARLWNVGLTRAVIPIGPMILVCRISRLVFATRLPHSPFHEIVGQMTSQPNSVSVCRRMLKGVAARFFTSRSIRLPVADLGAGGLAGPMLHAVARWWWRLESRLPARRVILLRQMKSKRRSSRFHHVRVVPGLPCSDFVWPRRYLRSNEFAGSQSRCFVADSVRRQLKRLSARIFRTGRADWRCRSRSCSRPALANGAPV
jgi:hypothetical protein